MMGIPDPLVPADVDLRDFQYMELDVRMLRDSRFAAQVTGDAFRAGVLLWCASWHQVPASSLPDDDLELANLAGYGRFIKDWRKVREQALTQFVKCSDGRLYHETVSAKALAAWNSRLHYHYDRARDRLRKLNKSRASEGLPALPELTFEAWDERRLSFGIPPERTEASNGIPEKRQMENGGIPPENALKGKGRGKGRGNVDGEGDLKKPIPDAQSAPATAKSPTAKRALNPEVQAACRSTWDAYESGYQQRYGTPPVRNAKVNAQVVQFVKRLGAEAADVIGFYLRHQGGYYIAKCHEFGAALNDAEKLRTEWATGRTATAASRRESLGETRAATLAGLTGGRIAPQPTNTVIEGESHHVPG